MRDRCRKQMGVVAGMLAAACMVPAAAGAATTTVGSELALPYDGGVSTSDTVTLQKAFAPGKPFPATSPVNGIVLQWKVRTSDDGALYSLRWLRPAGTDVYLGAGTQQAPEPVPPGTDDAILTYPGGNLPVRKGDYIGIFQTGDSDEGLPQNTTNGIPANVISNNFSGLPADGATAPFLDDQQHELLVQAIVHYCAVPKVKGKKAKLAKQLLAGADCGVKVKKKAVKKKKQRGKVIKQKPAAGTTAAPGTPVKITVGTKPKKKKKKK